MTTPIITNDQRILYLFEEDHIVTPRASEYEGQGFSASQWRRDVTSGGYSTSSPPGRSLDQSQSFEGCYSAESENDDVLEPAEKSKIHYSTTESSDSE